MPTRTTENSDADAGAVPKTARVEAWLSRHARRVLCVLLAVAALVRVVHLVEAADGPAPVLHAWQDTDMNFFDRWADEIAAGDWAMDRPLHPVHEWHRRIAAIHFADHPEQVEAFAMAGDGDPAQGLWDHWYGGRRFHQEPAYAYLLGFARAFFGAGVRAAFVVQMLLGIATVGLLHAVTRRMFGHTEAAVAGLFAALCGPLVFYETVLLRATLITFSSLLLILLVSVAAERDTRRSWFGAGLALGLAALVKMTFGMFALGVVAWVVLSRHRRPRAAAAAGGAVVLGIMAGLAPAAGRNLLVGVSPLAMSSVNAITFIQANEVDYAPAQGFHDSMRHSPRIMAATDGRFLEAVLATLRTHPSVGSYVGQLGGKLASMWHWYEKPNNANFYAARHFAPVLHALPISFGVIGPLGLLGLLLALPRIRTQWPLLGMVATLVVTMLLSYVLSRFRLPLMVALMPFAAFACVRLCAWRSQPKVPLVAGMLVAIGVACFVTWRPRPSDVPLIRVADHAAAFQVYFAPRAEEAGKAGDWPAAAAVFAEMLRTEPATLAQLDAERPARGGEQIQLAAAFANIRLLHADALARAGDADAARQAQQRGLALQAAARGGRP